MAGEDDVDVDVDDDFSFPTTTCSPPRFIGSPRLWRSSSHSHKHLLQTKLTKQEHEHEHDYECRPTLDDRKAINVLSYIRRKDAYGEGSGENMDVIWEDLNYEEEIGGTVRRRNARVSCDFGRQLPQWGDKDGGVTVACGGGRSRSMVVLVNVLKKILLLHQSERRRTTEYAYAMRVTMAGNVYSFGVILLELLTGKTAVSEGSELAKWVSTKSKEKHNFHQILDSNVSRTSSAIRDQMLAVLKVALACVNISPEARPNMRSVLLMLLNVRN